VKILRREALFNKEVAGKEVMKAKKPSTKKAF